MVDHTSTTIQDKTVWGNKRIHTGKLTFSGGTSSAGTLSTGLTRVEAVYLTQLGSGSSPQDTLSPIVTTTLPANSSTINVDTGTANQHLQWVAWGR